MMEDIMQEILIREIYHHPESRKIHLPPTVGFKYNVVGKPKQERFYGVGNAKWWYQWNEPND